MVGHSCSPFRVACLSSCHCGLKFSIDDKSALPTTTQTPTMPSEQRSDEKLNSYALLFDPAIAP